MLIVISSLRSLKLVWLSTLKVVIHVNSHCGQDLFQPCLILKSYSGWVVVTQSYLLLKLLTIPGVVLSFFFIIIFLQANSLDTKQSWVTKIRHLINNRFMYDPSNKMPPNKLTSAIRLSGISQGSSERNSRDLDTLSNGSFEDNTLEHRGSLNSLATGASSDSESSTSNNRHSQISTWWHNVW